MSNDDELFWCATNLRERVGADYESMYYSPAGALAALQLCHCKFQV